MPQEIDYSQLSQEELIELLKEKDTTIAQSVIEVKTLSLQKDKDALPVIVHEGKNYQGIVHSCTIVEGSGIEAGAVFVQIKKLTSEDAETIEHLIEKGMLVEIKD